MYRKYICLIFLCNIIFTLCWFNVEKIADARAVSRPAFQMEATEEKISQTSIFMDESKEVSVQRVVDVNVLETERIQISKEDYDVLLKIVEAEAGGEDENGKLLVANVILNRVEDSKFPDTVKDVVFQQDNGTSQFSPVADGRFYNVTVSEETKNAVERALCGEDISQGALYFAARKIADPERMKWFDENLELLFSYGGHEFFY
ncbi:MAG: cell wall hydrolase [Lachnospiraceae bacterium]|nr:cell wall hydrolase [Lachnospiraceae bacterium]